MLRKLLLSLPVLLALGVPAAGAVHDVGETYAFRHLRSDNSLLSFNSVMAIAQDAHGFVWVGTSDGMNRYDGTVFKVYRKGELGLQSAFVVSLCADGEGNLWTGTDSGVTCYDYATDRFIPLTCASDLGTTIHNKVTCIRIDRSGLVWMAVNSQGLFSYDPRSGELKNYFFRDGATTLPAGITSFCIDGNGDFWFDLYCLGVFRADRELTEIVPMEGFEYLKGDYIVDIARNRMNSTLLCASVERGLFEIDPLKGEMRTLIKGVAGMVPYKLFVDDDTYIWLPSTEGLWRYDIHSREVTRFTNDPDDEFSLGEKRITSVFRDSSGGLWAGTSAYGVDYCGSFQNLFHRYAMADGESLHGSLPRSMCADADGRIWIGTETQGLLCYDSAEGKLSRYGKSTLLPDGIFSLCYDDGILWAGTYRGVARLDIATGRTKFYVEANDIASLNDNKLYAIRKISDGRILVGTPLGLLVYDRFRDNFVHTRGLDGVFVTDILQDSSGRIWVASYAHGIFLYNIDKDEAVEHWSSDGEKEIPSNKINALMEDSSGRIWATSYSSGFFCLEYEGVEGRVYNTGTCQSVSSDMAFVMQEDSRERLWITSNKGLMGFNPGTGEIDTYTVDNGLLDNEFNVASGIRLPDGSLLLGSTNGLVRFQPKDLDITSTSSDIVVTDFRVGSRVLQPLEDGSPLTCNINETKRIVLPSRYNSFGVRVTVPCLPAPYSGGISYQLEGFDSAPRHLSWTGRPRNLYWGNVPPGRYLLKMSCGSHVHDPIVIIVRRHPLLSVVAIFLYVLLFVGILIGLAYYISLRAKRSSELASYNDKMAFFTNIIHEIKTPLTLIRTPLQNIMTMRGKDGSELDEDLATISRSTDYMDKLVREMLDFVRIEQNGYKMTYSEVDLVEKLRLISETFAETARSKNLSLEFVPASQSITVHADDSAVTKIINNLLHNAVKYAETAIRVSVRQDGDVAELRILNDGAPIPRSRRKEIFKPFVQFSGDNGSYAQSFGVGLALARTLAERHGGTLTLDDSPRTCFVLRLPLNADIPVPDTSQADEQTAETVPSELPTVLVVEDNEDLQKYLKRKLESEFNVLAVSTAEAAMKLVVQGDVDLVVSDIALGGTSGIELCRRITASFENSHIVIIMLSAISSVNTKLEAMESGASLYIEKPFDLEYLISSIKILLDKRRLMRASYIDDMHPDVGSYSLPGSDETFLRNLDNIVMFNLPDASFSVDQLSESLNLSRATLIRKMKGLLGTTPSDYIRLKRLSVAARLLENNTTRVSEVCYSVGFNTPSYFAKCFRARYGMLPGEYMREHTRQKDNQSL